MTSTIRPGPVPTLERHQLSGGLPVVLQRRSGPALLAARLAVAGGSSLDPAGARGAHQLLAGAMTRGCGERGAEALADLVEGAGAALRADAHEDAVVVALKCAAEDAASLLPLLLTMVRRPLLQADQVELERQLNLQMLQRQREDPFQLAYDQLRQRLYGEGPYGHDPLGVEEELRTVSSDTLRALQGELGGQGAVLVLCGEPPQDFLELLEAELRLSPWSTAAPLAAAAAVWTPPASRLIRLEQDTEQLVLMLGTATVPLGHADALPLRLLRSHLGQGMSSRLFRVLREERGLAYDVGVHLPARRGPAPFVLHLSTSAGRAAEATACLIEEWARLLDDLLQEEELGLALAKLRGHDAMARQTCSQNAERLALLLGHGLAADHGERALERAGSLGPQDLREAARRWLRTPCLSLVGPATALEAAAAAWRQGPLRDPPSTG
jgi:predicted Zn-dependent peptidase